MTLQPYADLWAPGAEKRYVLVRLPGRGEDDLLPYDAQDRQVVLIDDDELLEEVVRRMKGAGVPVSEGVPR
jgi:hypothetical protein